MARSVALFFLIVMNLAVAGCGNKTGGGSPPSPENYTDMSPKAIPAVSLKVDSQWLTDEDRQKLFLFGDDATVAVVIYRGADISIRLLKDLGIQPTAYSIVHVSDEVLKGVRTSSVEKWSTLEGEEVSKLRPGSYQVCAITHHSGGSRLFLQSKGCWPLYISSLKGTKASDVEVKISLLK